MSIQSPNEEDPTRADYIFVLGVGYCGQNCNLRIRERRWRNSIYSNL